MLETDSMGVTPIPDISTRPAIPNQCEEDVLADEIIEDVPGVGEALVISYKLIEGATRGGKILLADSLGYTYTEKSLGKKKIQCEGKKTWRCSVRSTCS